MKKGCIFLISARKNILKTCLQYLNANYNKVFKYPILIFYHGSKYDDLDFQDSIKSINPDVQTTFHKLECKIPDHLQEKDLFYNLDCSYVRKVFPNPERVIYMQTISGTISWIILNLNSMNT